jgi:hypothetical protein
MQNNAANLVMEVREFIVTRFTESLCQVKELARSILSGSACQLVTYILRENA